MILNIKLDALTLQFNVLNNPVATKWLNRMNLREDWCLDDPSRFYGFGTQKEEEQIALDKINYCITAIGMTAPNIDRELVDSVHNQDRLNYWHHVFETHHGLLGQEDRNNSLTLVLADLNLAVHRCESVARGNRPRFVCTWYGMPKTETLPTELMKEYGTLNPKFGSVCLNYCEIGKTLEDLTQDSDKYIGDEAFKPFNHYSADFTVRFYEETVMYVTAKLNRMKKYYNDHNQFFYDRGYNSSDDIRLLPWRFPVAELVETMPREELVKTIAKQQTITQVWIE